MITLYNVADDVEAEESKVTTLVERNDYSALAVVPLGEEPLELAQARYAVAIARAAGADRFAPQQYASATQNLTAAETALAGGRKGPQDRNGLGACGRARRRGCASRRHRRRGRRGGAQRAAATAAAATAEANRAAACRPGRICVIG